MQEPDESTRLRLWRFVRGDEPVEAFEPWVYAEPALEALFGPALHFDAIATNFRDQEAVRALRVRLATRLRSLPGPSCLCIRLRDLEIVDMGLFRAPEPAFEADREWRDDDVLATLKQVRAAAEPRWWLSAARCTTCGDAWLVGSDGRQNDVVCLRRLDGEELRAIEERDRWPDDFASYERLLQLGSDGGRSVRFVDSLDPSLRDTVTELARARPGIKVSELAGLLNLDLASTVELARRVEATSGVTITFDQGPRR